MTNFQWTDEQATRIAKLSLRYPELNVAQLEALDTLGERCQNCGSSFTVDPTASKLVTIHPGYHVAGTSLEQREVQTTVAFCNGCEFAVELQRRQRKSPRHSAWHVDTNF